MADVSLVQALLRVVLVFALLAVTLHVVGRMTGRRPGRGGVVLRRGSMRERRAVEVIDRQSLGRTASLALVRIGDRHVALGVTDQRVSLLAEVPHLDSADRPSATASFRSSPAGLAAARGRPVVDLSERIPAARTRTADIRRPWRDLIEDLRERTVR